MISVNNRLNELEVDAVISLFSHLSAEQKVMALSKFKEMVNITV